LAVVVARRGGAVQLERDVLGNTRIDVVSPEARALGVRPGQTVAAARAKHADLRVRVVAEEDVQTELARVAEAALSFGPAAGFDSAQDVVWVDVGGCQHLRGGERELARALVECVHELGHACRVAIASGPRVASAVARHAPSRSIVVVPEGKDAEAMRGLPVAALGLDDDVTCWLVDLGLKRCGDLQRLPRRSLGARLGARVLDVMQLLDGDDRAPLVAWRPPEVPEERVSLDWGVSSVDALAFVLKALCDRLASRLERRAMAASRLELVLSLDRALCALSDGKQPSVSSLHVVLPTPMNGAGELLAVLRARLEGHVLAAPALTVVLRAPELSRRSQQTLDMLAPEPKAERALPRLVAELAAELGDERVGTLALVDTWAPAERTKVVPFGGRQAQVKKAVPPGTLLTSALEPTRLVKPCRLEKSALTHVRLLSRVEGVAWWRHREDKVGLTATVPFGRAVDVASAWVASRKGGALAWVELRPDDALLRGWID
jgi:protein ImuB